MAPFSRRVDVEGKTMKGFLRLDKDRQVGEHSESENGVRLAVRDVAWQKDQHATHALRTRTSESVTQFAERFE
jgi:hypothetical protein